MEPAYKSHTERCINNNRKVNVPSLRRMLVNRNYAKLWYGQAVSAIGDTVFGTTLVLWVSQVLAHGLPWAPAAVSGILVAAGAAVALVGPVAGVFVDRWNRKSTMMRTEVIRVAMVAGLTGLSFVPVRDLPTGLWLGAVYLVVFVLNAAPVLQPGQVRDDRRRGARRRGPGTSSRPRRGHHVGGRDHRSADRGAAADYRRLPVGPGRQRRLLRRVLSGHPLPAADARASPGSPRRSGETSLHAEFSAGLRLFARNRFLVTLLTVTMICQCGTGAITALNVFFVTRDLHASSRLFGIAETAMGVGFIIGALAAGRMVRWIGARALTWSGLLATGVLAAGYALQRSFPAGLVMLAIYAMPIAMLNTAVAPLLLGAVPREYLGRVMAVFTPVNQLASMLSMVISGWLTSTVLRSFRASFAGVPSTRSA